MILYHYYRSSCSWRVRWAFHHKNIPVKLVAVNLLQAEQHEGGHVKKNPTHYVPVLEVNGQYYGESMAILEWIEENYPTPALLPNDPISRLRVRQLAQIIVAGTQPLQNMTALEQYKDPAEREVQSRKWIDRGLASYEEILQSGVAGTYSVGSQLSFADLCLIPQCYNALRNNLDLSSYPLVHRIYKHCLELESCRKTAPENYV